MLRWIFLILLVLLGSSADAQPMIKLEAHGGRFLALEDDAVAYLPDPDPSGAPPPLMIVLHGAGGNAATALRNVIGEASLRGIALVAVKSQAGTWDALGPLFSNFSGSSIRLPGGDKKRIEDAVAALKAEAPIDEDRIALFGFSDGATMALSLGADSPKDYPFVIAFAPGGVIQRHAGKAAANQLMIIAHGTADRIIPYRHDLANVCPKVAVGKRSVRFITFEGGHRVNQSALRDVLDAFLDRSRTVGIEGCP